MKVAILGYGWVGKAMHDLFPSAFIYSRGIVRDERNGFQVSGISTKVWGKKYKEDMKKEANNCDVAFICVPTPNENNSALDTSIVEECVSWCKCPLLVVRSTVNPGDCDRWAKKYNKHIVMQPEYLGETPSHPMLDATKRQFLVIGGEVEDRRKLIDLYATVYNANINIRQVTALEAEIIKLTENRAISFKVAQCQELYDVCEAAGIDYYTIRDAVYGDDPRFSLWWTLVYPLKRGFKSKCIPKDVYAWCSWAESVGYSPEITKSILLRNEKWIK